MKTLFFHAAKHERNDLVIRIFYAFSPITLIRLARRLDFTTPSTVGLNMSLLSFVVVIDLIEVDKSDERERKTETFHRHRTHKLLLLRGEMNVINSNQDWPRNLYHSSCDILNPRSSNATKTLKENPNSLCRKT